MQTKVPEYVRDKKYTKDKLEPPISVGNPESHLGGLEPSAIEAVVRSSAISGDPLSFPIASAPYLDIEFVDVCSIADQVYILKICGIHCAVGLKLSNPIFKVLDESLFFIEGNTTTQ